MNSASMPVGLVVVVLLLRRVAVVNAWSAAVVADMEAWPGTSTIEMCPVSCSPQAEDAKIPLNVEPHNEPLKFLICEGLKNFFHQVE